MPTLLILYCTVTLDAIGLGLVFPILPRLLQAIAPQHDTAFAIGVVTAVYALAQLLFAPVLGALSDRVGRRPVLLLSLAGAVASYLAMAAAASFWQLLLARAIAGLTSANLAIANASIADLSDEHTRAGRFGLLNGLFGVGFIIGPVLGGALGDVALRAPFLLAALLHTLNLLAAALLFRAPRAAPAASASLHPLATLRWLAGAGPLRRLALLFFLFSVAGEVYGTCWALWSGARFAWRGLDIGLSLGVFGVCQALAQAVLAGRVVRRFGERRAALGGVVCAGLALSLLALASRPWMVFAIMPVIAVSGMGAPALQAMAARAAPPAGQGRLQGALAATLSLAAVIGPLLFATLYGWLSPRWPGAIWLCVLPIYAVAWRLLRRTASA